MVPGICFHISADVTQQIHNSLIACINWHDRLFLFSHLAEEKGNIDGTIKGYQRDEMLIIRILNSNPPTDGNYYKWHNEAMEHLLVLNSSGDM